MDKQKPTVVLNNYWKDNDRFADFFNHSLFRGDRVVDPAMLSDAATDESTTVRGGRDAETVERHRDLLKQLANGTRLMLIGLENQSLPHYGMPVRKMTYDSLNYVNQCRVLGRANRAGGDLDTPGEFLSGVRRGDRLNPVLTVVLCYGEGGYDGPMRLSDMMDIPEAFRPYVNDYELHLVSIRDLAGMGFANSDNRDLFTLVGEFYSSSRRIDIRSFGEKYPSFRVSWEVLAAFGAITGARKLVRYAYKNEGGR
jgi:hypothetical protein